MSRYICCQGYFNCACFEAGKCGEPSCPEFCLALEACCCLGPSMSASRMFMMDMYELQSDPMDNRIVRFNNCLQVLSCICHILAMFDRNLGELAGIIDWIAKIVFYCTIGCMAAQVNHEIDYRKTAKGQAEEYAAYPVASPIMSEQTEPLKKY